jgi:hypothetical protein
MAWFDPPLYKPGNKRCPNCGHPLGWNRWWGSSIVRFWAGWRCTKCQSVLTFDVGRRIAWALLWIAVAIGWWMTKPFSWPVILNGGFTFVIALLALFAATGLVWWWFESFKLKSTPA